MASITGRLHFTRKAESEIATELGKWYDSREMFSPRQEEGAGRLPVQERAAVCGGRKRYKENVR